MRTKAHRVMRRTRRKSAVMRRTRRKSAVMRRSCRRTGLYRKRTGGTLTFEIDTQNKSPKFASDKIYGDPSYTYMRFSFQNECETPYALKIEYVPDPRLDQEKDLFFNPVTLYVGSDVSYGCHNYRHVRRDHSHYQKTLTLKWVNTDSNMIIVTLKNISEDAADTFSRYIYDDIPYFLPTLVPKNQIATYFS